jgi:chemosensory pili system protein ChpB (putative protein-glutamate methylesterase)
MAAIDTGRKCIGILVDSASKQQYLGNMVVQAGHDIGYVWVLSANTGAPDLNQPVDAWVVDLCEPDEEARAGVIYDLLESLAESRRPPVLVNDSSEFKPGSSEHQQGVRRMLQRLERISGDINLQDGSSASEVWVLGASTGGPAAVKDFLKALPPKLGIAFVYVQHIDSGQADTLVKMMSGAGHYPAQIARQGTVLMRDSLTLVTADSSLRIHDNGTLALDKTPWGGSYAPSIDQVGANVARVYRQRSGIIIFSGMGDDGAASCRLIRQQGGKVWVQTPEQCTISSMPDAAIATGTVNFIGAPPELAAQLARWRATAKYRRPARPR